MELGPDWQGGYSTTTGQTSGPVGWRATAPSGLSTGEVCPNVYVCLNFFRCAERTPIAAIRQGVAIYDVHIPCLMADLLGDVRSIDVQIYDDVLSKCCLLPGGD